jgi:hypothetical protein
LTGARDSLRKLRTDQRELTKNPGFIQFGLGIESQILSVQSQIATQVEVTLTKLPALTSNATICLTT